MLYAYLQTWAVMYFTDEFARFQENCWKLKRFPSHHFYATLKNNCKTHFCEVTSVCTMYMLIACFSDSFNSWTTESAPIKFDASYDHILSLLLSQHLKKKAKKMLQAKYVRKIGSLLTKLDSKNGSFGSGVTLLFGFKWNPLLWTTL